MAGSYLISFLRDLKVVFAQMLEWPNAGFGLAISHSGFLPQKVCVDKRDAG